MPSNSTDNSAQNIDVKDISRRVKHLGYITAFIAIIISWHYYSIHILGSAAVVLGFACALNLVFYLHYMGIIRRFPFYLILITNLLLITTSILEGSGTGQYLFFFPLFVAIPCVLDLKKLSKRDIILYYGLSGSSFVFCMLVEHFFQPVQHISAQLYHQIFLINICASSALTVIFALAYTYFEHKYIKQLHDEQHKAVTARTRFLSTMGHELRTPLNGIIGAISILGEEGKIDKDDAYFQILKYCSDHMLQQINDILDFNKIEAGKLEIHPVKVNLHQLLTSAALPFYSNFEKKKLKLQVEIDDQLDVDVMADDVRLVQILNNLLSNALKFTSEGFVRLKVDVAENSKNRMVVQFSVKDTGMGIAEKDQKKIFDGFWQVYDQTTRHHNGTGLGLNICLRILEMMNSKLNLSSRKGRGSEFTFRIDFVKYDYHHTTEKVQQAFTDAGNLAGTRILIVEDNPINMTVAQKILTTLQATFSAATNGKEALDALLHDSNYDVILLDLEMPVMNGYDAIIDIKKLYPHIPVLAFTASLVDQQMLDALLASGFSDVVLKPFQPQQLLAQIAKYVVVKPELEL